MHASTTYPYPRAAAGAARRASTGARYFLPAVAALVGAAWLASRYGDYTPGSDLGYFLGLAGGIALLLVFLYPLRKRLRFMQAWGASKAWFALHMACGIAAPLLILVHSKFQVGSLNAGVALTCMLLVAASGIVGRFIYVRIHHGLYGTRMTLAQLQAEVGLNAGELQSKLSFAPEVARRLAAFEAAALARPGNVLQGAWRFVTLGWRARWVRRRCIREFARVYRMHARAFGWDAARQRRHLAGGRAFIVDFVNGAQRVAQFSRYERLFSLWHVLHVPFVWMMLLSAIAHVVAVHAY
ncbi:MAG: hypothetical protein OEV81_06720 [Betaproteobacteria bacterium]|nr:hypothetical protein [Betaproteobacteria bacterium]MDH5221538.1 hypothetical protein [Betaproteobacteria bacterium]MDH5350934.1 hypothetical protein [Betaproteobacteria bacterium]